MRLIAPSNLAARAQPFPEAREALERWQTLIEATDFAHSAALRRAFPHADQVTVGSGQTVTVFNIRGNRYRLLAALHYRGQRCDALRFMGMPNTTRHCGGANYEDNATGGPDVPIL